MYHQMSSATTYWRLAGLTYLQVRRLDTVLKLWMPEYVCALSRGGAYLMHLV